jgi:HD-like signal output (HDOD) protein
MITRQTVADKIAAYLQHAITLEQLVEWAESAMMDDDFAAGDISTLRKVISRLGLADVRNFGLSWDDCEQLLRELGYSARVDIVAA